MQDMQSRGTPDTCDLCIVGAGIAGLNALFVATLYLPATARVVIVDKNMACGGMWTETYDYVRLHQPHTMFTAGDIPWSWDRPAEYLATGAEVQAHLSDCLNQLCQKVKLTKLFGFSCEGYEEVVTSGGPRTRILCRNLNRADDLRTIEAKRTINAAGWAIPVTQPLKLSSQNIVSTTPGLLPIDDKDPETPAVIVGGGKTGMDTFQTLKHRAPHRKISLINGRGTVFGNRDVLFPTGGKRWWSGKMVSFLSRDITMRFDGQNGADVFAYFLENYALSPAGRGSQYFFSTLSGEEASAVKNGLDEIVCGYLEDVTDTKTGPEIVLRSGERIQLSSGSLVINCTGHLLRHPRHYEPFISKLGTVLSINTRSSVYFLSSSAAYFLSHVFFLGKFNSLPLYELDMDTLLENGRNVFFLTCLTHSFYNMLVIMDNVPIQVFSRCGLDLNRWFPLPRRLASLVMLKMHLQRYTAHCRNTLDYIHSEYAIRCGLLDRRRTISPVEMRHRPSGLRAR